MPENVQKRLELFQMFYPLERKYERRWGRTFDSTFDEIVPVFSEQAIEKGYEQKTVEPQTILWQNPNDGSVECMFCFVVDASNFDQVQNIFTQIKKHKAYLTYAIIHQKKDGEGVFDIFRHSRFSYLEHCNRVKSTKKHSSVKPI